MEKKGNIGTEAVDLAPLRTITFAEPTEQKEQIHLDFTIYSAH